MKAPDTKVINTVGAGDSMVAGFIAGLKKYNDYYKALAMGTAARKCECIFKIFRNTRRNIKYV